MIVELSTEDLKYCSTIGQQRHDENVGRAHIAAYSGKYTINALQAHKLGVLAEYAVGKFLGYDPQAVDLDTWASFVPSSDYAKYTKHADWPGVEVRRCNNRSNPLPIREKDLEPAGRLIHVYCPYEQTTFGGPIKVAKSIELLGWAHTTDYHNGTVPGWSKTGKDRVVERRPMGEWS